MLEAVSQEPEGLSNAEISRKLDIPKSSASYILRTLEKQGYLNRDSEREVQGWTKDTEPEPRCIERY